MDSGFVLGALIVVALMLAIGGGLVAARFLNHAAAQATREAASDDR